MSIKASFMPTKNTAMDLYTLSTKTPKSTPAIGWMALSMALENKSITQAKPMKGTSS